MNNSRKKSTNKLRAEMLSETQNNFQFDNPAEDFAPCCACKEHASCESIEETFKNIETYIEITDVNSVLDTPSRKWLISSAADITSEDVFKLCKVLFRPHRIVDVEAKGRTWNDDGFKFLLHLNHRLNEAKMEKLFSKQRILKIEQRDLVEPEEFFYWKNYVTKQFPSLALSAWGDNETEALTNEPPYEEDFGSSSQRVSEENDFLTPEELNKIICGSPSIPEDQLDDQLLCRICYENQFDHAIIPCGHTLCITCSDKYQMSCPEIRCPHCRGDIFGLIKLHF